MLSPSPKANHQSNVRIRHKKSLTDWRTLYSDNRPKSQSLILNFNQNRKHFEVFPSRNQNSYQMKSKNSFYLHETVNNPKSKYWPRLKANNLQISQTATNFYETPLKNEI